MCYKKNFIDENTKKNKFSYMEKLQKATKKSSKKTFLSDLV